MAYERQMDYIDVATRLTEMRDLFPDLTMSQVSMEFVVVAGTSWVVYTAAAYRTPDDPRPGIGTAWEPIPGPTPFTKDSEVQNAETAAWGRALIAIGASTKNGIASKEEVTNRQQPGEYRNSQRIDNEPAFEDNEPRTVNPNVGRQAPQGYIHGSGNTDFDIILQAATLSNSEFIHSLAEQIEKRGSLTDKQIASGVPQAYKIVTGG
jgi:hypothetical protein